MTDTPKQGARNLTNQTKARIAGSVLMWLFSGVYTVSPIDLIPDLIPVLGLADDLFIVLVAVAFTVYTVTTIRTRGIAALRPGPVLREPSRPAIDVQPVGEPADGYQPVPVDEIKRL